MLLRRPQSALCDHRGAHNGNSTEGLSWRHRAPEDQHQSRQKGHRSKEFGHLKLHSKREQTNVIDYIGMQTTKMSMTNIGDGSN